MPYLIAVILVCALFSSSFAQASNQPKFFDKDLRINFQGKSYFPVALAQEAMECFRKMKQKRKKGEYETQAEFKKRSAAMANECDVYKNALVTIETSTKLEYSSDNKEFNFSIPYSSISHAGTASKPAYSFRAKWAGLGEWSLNVDDKFFEGRGNRRTYQEQDNFYIKSPIQKARQLKSLEENLRNVYTGYFSMSPTRIGMNLELNVKSFSILIDGVQELLRIELEK